MLIWREDKSIINVDITKLIQMIQQEKSFAKITEVLKITEKEIISILDSMLASWEELESKKYE